MSRVEKLKARQAEELARAEREEKIAALVSHPEGVSFGIHAHRDEVWVSYGSRSYEPASLDTLRQLAAEMPAEVPLMLTRGTFTSIKTVAAVEAMTDEQRDKDHAKGETEIAPFIVELDELKGYAPQASFKWWIEVLGEQVRIEVVLPLNAVKLGRWVIERHRHGGHVHGMVKADAYHPASDLHTIHNAEGESLAGLESPIKWASGSPEAASKRTLYWAEYGGSAPTVLDLINTMEEGPRHGRS